MPNTLYCDHGGYGEASFNGSIAAGSGNATMTVTSMLSGIITIGMLIQYQSGGSPVNQMRNGVCVTGYGTGSGGVGTYTVNAVGTHSDMCTVTPGRFGGCYGLPAIAPAFGTTQEGDGLGPGLATSATLDIDLADYTSVADSTLIIAGAVLTAKASPVAASAQFAVASGNALAVSIAAAINGAANTTVVNQPSIGGAVQAAWNRPPLRCACYAVAVGSVLRIQTRAGSALYNNNDALGWVVNSNGFSFAAPATGQIANAKFSGGVSGAWGWLINGHSNITMWPSAQPSGSYGVFGGAGTMNASTQKPIAGPLPQPKDTVIARTRNRMIVSQINSTFSLYLSYGNDTGAVTLQMDDGTVWPDDGPNPVFRIVQGCNNSTTAVAFPITAQANMVVRANAYANGQRSLVFETGNSWGQIGMMSVTVGSGMNLRYENLEFYHPYIISSYNSCVQPQETTRQGSNSCYYATSGNPGGYATCATLVLNCKMTGPSSGIYIGNNQAFVNLANLAYSNTRFVQCEFGYTENSAISDSGIFQHWYGSGLLEFEACKFNNFLTGSTLMSKNASGMPGGLTVLFRDCDLGNISYRGPHVGYNTAANQTYEGVYGTSKIGKRDFFSDTRAGFCSWNSAGAFPVKLGGAILPDGTPWSLQFIAPTQLSVGGSRGFAMPVIQAINSLETGNRTLTVEFLLDTRIAWTRANLGFIVSWVNSANKVQIVDTAAVDGPLTPSLATWSGLNDDAANPASVVGYNFLTYARYKLQMSLTDVPKGAELVVTPKLYSRALVQGVGGFIDYDMVLA
jgi:hypothetical protein